MKYHAHDRATAEWQNGQIGGIHEDRTGLKNRYLFCCLVFSSRVGTAEVGLVLLRVWEAEDDVPETD